MSTCDACGSTLTDADKNAAGHFRDRCLDCLEAIAAAIPSHVDSCDDPDCLVCADYRSDRSTD